MNSADIKKANAKLIRRLLFVAVAMFGFGFALVPIYDVFCDITGINGKTKGQAVAGDAKFEMDANREITVEFLTSLNEKTPMTFRAEVVKMKVHPGRSYRVNYYAENVSGKRLMAQAIPSITPGPAAEYFLKTQCFCFSEQTFEPGEAKNMPLQFIVNPELPERYKTITLAYTFFDISDKAFNQK
ncbi:MAG: cytochrome c oxidase assembly protein [Pseudomonadota bacterium]